MPASWPGTSFCSADSPPTAFVFFITPCDRSPRLQPFDQPLLPATLFHQQSASSYEGYERYGGGAEQLVLQDRVLCLLGVRIGSAVLDVGSAVVDVGGAVFGSVVLGSTKRARDGLLDMGVAHSNDRAWRGFKPSELARTYHPVRRPPRGALSV